MALESASWSTQLVLTNPSSADPRSQGDDHLRLIKSVVQGELAPENRQWVFTGDAVTWVASTAFTLASDQTAKYEAGRRLKVTGSSTGTIYGHVSSSTFSSTCRVNLEFDSGSMTNETLATYVGALTHSNWSLPFRLGTFTPTFDFATSGDLSNAYSEQTGEYIRLGPFVYVVAIVRVVPTFTTGSGALRIAGLPFTKPSTVETSLIPAQAFTTPTNDGLTFPTGVTTVYAFIASNTDYLQYFGNGDGGYNQSFDASHMTSGKDFTFRATGIYTV